MFEINSLTIKKNISSPLLIALVPDLHDKPYEHIIKAIKEGMPDLIAVPGDLANSYTKGFGTGLQFLRECAQIAPTFYSSGNHEYRFGGIPAEDIEETGAVFLDNRFANFENMYIGGFPTKGDLNKLDNFCMQAGFKILLSHHPEYYPRHLCKRDIDLILAGHAHGGQVRIFGRGLYSPGQGIFPKLTSGVHDNRLVISRGLCNNQKVPRLWNNPELLFVKLLPAN